jgi:diguanylate cyclase (GGDEF)-like protein
MWSKIKQRVSKWQEVLISASCMTGLTLLGNMMGLFQPLELKAFDQLTRLRPTEPRDNRIVIVTIDEQDLENYGFPIPDQKLAQAIKNLKQENPRVIALDLYRNLPQEPGYEELVEEFKTTDNLIGVEKVIGESVPPPHTLPPEKVALADIVVDSDNKVRRALLSIQRENGQIQMGLGSLAALTYLADDYIYLEQVEPAQSKTYQLGEATIKPFAANHGGYVRADAGGYQMLLNYRGVEYKFSNYSLTDVIEGKTPANWVRNRIVFIGSVSESVNDRFLTPFSSSSSRFPVSTPGVVIHANIASQLLSAALDGRHLTRVIDDYVEWGWLLLWCLLGATQSWQFLEKNLIQNSFLFWSNLFVNSILMPSIILIGFSYILFIYGWWIPVVTPLIGLSLSALAIPNYRNYIISKDASLDSLTQVANRRYFDIFYPKLWNELQRSGKPLSVILCDVDYFKLYNDNYGHQAGDKCLYQVAQAISKAVRSTDIVIRYGGEEFIVILPETDQKTGFKIGERICHQIRSLEIPHQHSQASYVVTISGGLATAYPHSSSTPDKLVAQADKNLYTAKAQGRNSIFTELDKNEKNFPS